MKSSDTPFTVYITRYALTKGMYSTEATLSDASGTINAGREGYFNSDEWDYTFDGARKTVLEKILSKRKSLTTQLAKLDKLEASLKAGLLP